MPRLPSSPLDRLISDIESALFNAANHFIGSLAADARRVAQQASKSLPSPPSPSPRPRSPRSRPDPATKSRKTRPSSPKPQEPTLYSILEVSETASPETISAAFRSLSLRYHPDKQETGNEAHYQRITAAWAVLKDPAHRRKYDRFLSDKKG